MLTLILAAAAASASPVPAVITPPCCVITPKVSKSQIAACTQFTLAELRLDEHSARRIPIGWRTNILELSETFNAGDSVWSKCADRLNEDAELVASYENLDREYQAFEKKWGPLRRKSQRAQQISTVVTLVARFLTPGY